MKAASVLELEAHPRRATTKSKSPPNQNQVEWGALAWIDYSRVLAPATRPVHSHMTFRSCSRTYSSRVQRLPAEEFSHSNPIEARRVRRSVYCLLLLFNVRSSDPEKSARPTLWLVCAVLVSRADTSWGGFRLRRWLELKTLVEG